MWKEIIQFSPGSPRIYFIFLFWHLSLSLSSQRSFDVRATRFLTIENYRYIFPERDVT
jgi:hypothetical protein